MDTSKTYRWKILHELDDISHLSKSLIAKTSPSPFSSLAFLHLLDTSNSTGKDSGWQAHHFCLYENETPVAFIPCYLKQHSYGEYVFDHAWANAYHQHGLAYYPKLLCAIPFTPVTTSKVLISDNTSLSEKAILNHWLENNESTFRQYSSLHALFLPAASTDEFSAQGFHERLNVQFVFYNNEYQSFDDFLQSLKSRKRKSIKKERQALYAQGVSIKRFCRDQVSAKLIDDFYTCYQATYLKRSGHKGYLTRAFFEGLRTHMSDNIMINAAYKNDTLVGAALFFFDEQSLFGRYWGALEEVSGLHFECCYYQGIEFTIEQNIKIFNPGTQGEHKILRGFTPTLCRSMHKIEHPGFNEAVADFVARERPHMLEYLENTQSLLPFKVE
ncbi:GNAT family N-acetyltransferase [Agaribacter flavus]|uniref:GNAT family N-acetyltransferase n=1 Tax=Agaribacter flavus TaxID=1902781 RepID=A0ABV7FJC6_9ALTE